MDRDAGDDITLVVETSLAFLLDVVFGVVERLIQRNTISRAEILALFQELKDEAASHEDGGSMALALIEAALCRVSADQRMIARDGKDSESDRSARAA